MSEDKKIDVLKNIETIKRDLYKLDINLISYNEQKEFYKHLLNNVIDISNKLQNGFDDIANNLFNIVFTKEPYKIHASYFITEKDKYFDMVKKLHITLKNKVNIYKNFVLLEEAEKKDKAISNEVYLEAYTYCTSNIHSLTNCDIFNTITDIIFEISNENESKLNFSTHTDDSMYKSIIDKIDLFTYIDSPEFKEADIVLQYKLLVFLSFHFDKMINSYIGNKVTKEVDFLIEENKGSKYYISSHDIMSSITNTVFAILHEKEIKRINGLKGTCMVSNEDELFQSSNE